MLGAEHVDVRLLVAADRPPGRRRQGVALREQHGVAGLCRPGRRRHRELRLRRRTRSRRCATACPPTSVRNASIAAASLAGSLPVMRRARRSPGARASPISIACAPRAAGAPVGLRVSSAVEVARGRSSPSVSRIGARSGRAISADAAMPAAPVVLVDERHGPRARAAGLAGIGRGRGPGGVRDRVLAAHPGGVLGGERGEAEHGLVGGLLLQPHLDGVVAAAAGTDRERREHATATAIRPQTAWIGLGARLWEGQASSGGRYLLPRPTPKAGFAPPRRGTILVG